MNEVRMYLIKKLEVVGTQQNPEIFSTGSGKLSTDCFGQTFPAFEALNQAIFISVGSAYQDAKIDLAGFQSVTDYGILSFKLAVSNAGNPSADGKYYCDLAIQVVSRC